VWLVTLIDNRIRIRGQQPTARRPLLAAWFLLLLSSGISPNSSYQISSLDEISRSTIGRLSPNFIHLPIRNEPVWTKPSLIPNRSTVCETIGKLELTAIRIDELLEKSVPAIFDHTLNIYQDGYKETSSSLKPTGEF
jgi:hypothetical protein